MKKPLFSCIAGIITAFAVWAAFTALDFVDEYVLDVAMSLNVFLFFGAPFILLAVYIVHCRRQKPGAKRLLAWFGGYTLAFLPLWYVIYDAVNNRTFIIPQRARSSGIIDLNGIEYIFFGFTAYCAFLAMCILYHVIAAAVKKARASKGAA